MLPVPCLILLNLSVSSDENYEALLYFSVQAGAEIMLLLYFSVE